MMRIVTWNCRLSLRKKLPKLMSLQPDIAVIQECERDLLVPEGYEYRWRGDDARKGLGVLSRSGLTSDVCASPEWTYFLPVYIPAKKLRVLAVWAFNHRAARRFGPGRNGNARAVIEALGEWLSQGRSIVIGDFNNSIKWDIRGNEYNFKTLDDVLRHLKFRSAYHAFAKQAYGSETAQTYFHTKKESHPHHIDYCFVHESIAIERVEISDYSAWRSDSDHVPVVTDLLDV